jgi:hypothetical protein
VLISGCRCQEGGGGRDDARVTPGDGGVVQSQVDAQAGVTLPPPSSSGKLTRFASADDLTQYVQRVGKVMSRRRGQVAATGAPGSVLESAAAPPSPAEAAETDTGGGTDSITNVQEAGVDEGDIVKVFGEYLVVLRRGRLFTVRLVQGMLQPVSMIDAFPPGAGSGGWYDEMLISRNTIVVVGYSYHAEATELGVFDISDTGQLSHRGTHYLRSNDYYSSRNYASRLIGDTLIFYMPYSLLETSWSGDQPRFSYTLPGIRRHGGDTAVGSWNEVITATSIFQPVQETHQPVLHTVVTCDLAAPELRCTAQGVVGPYGRDFYVSGNAVYVWVHGGRAQPAAQDEVGPDAVVYRLPLRGGEPGALWVSGVPTDQFSFKESDDQVLNVLVRSGGGGEGMWGSEYTEGDVVLMRVPVSQFLEGVTAVGAERYTRLPRPPGSTFQNRFVGDHVLYGTGSGWGYPGAQAQGNQVFVHPYRGGGMTTTLALPHGVDRIEVMGRNAVVIGTDGQNLLFSAVELGPQPRVSGRYMQENAAQGELRSHGFFYRPVNDREGYLGLPVRGGGSPGMEHLVNGSAEVLFLHVQDSMFSRLGSLASSPSGQVEDSCVASCVDWYGNARPIFYGGRVFALLGYELVEGQIAFDRITEMGRTNFFAGQPGRALMAPTF